MRTEPSRPGLLLRILLAAIPADREEIACGLVAEAQALGPGPERRAWLVSAYNYAFKEGLMTWIRLAVSGASAVFILWIAYNAIDSDFKATAPQLASYIGLVALLATSAALIAPWARLRAMLGAQTE